MGPLIDIPLDAQSFAAAVRTNVGAVHDASGHMSPETRAFSGYSSIRSSVVSKLQNISARRNMSTLVVFKGDGVQKIIKLTYYCGSTRVQ